MLQLNRKFNPIQDNYTNNLSVRKNIIILFACQAGSNHNNVSLFTTISNKYFPNPEYTKEECLNEISQLLKDSDNNYYRINDFFVSEWILRYGL